MVDHEPRLSFSANGSGVTLHTKYGGLVFSAEEFSYYQSIFKVADNTNRGNLLIGGIQLNMLLIRSDIHWINIEKAIKITMSKDTEEEGFHFNNWLMLCKLLACHQETKKIPSEKLFKSLHSKAIKVPFAEFNLSKSKVDFVGGKLYKDYSVEVVGWKIYGEDYQHQHVKFRISTDAQIVNESSAKCVATQERITVERRYSDFVSFANILHRNHKGLVVPPLPQKSWPFVSSSADSQNDQRRHEFQLFLSDLAAHPVLKHSFELKCFLDASSSSFKSFVELYSHVTAEGRVRYSGTGGETTTGVGKMINDGASAVSEVGQAVAQTKAFGYLSSLWGIVSKSVFPAAVPHVERQEDVAAFAKTSRLLEELRRLGEHLERIVSLETANALELSKVGQNLKNVRKLCFSVIDVTCCADVGIRADPRPCAHIADCL